MEMNERARLLSKSHSPLLHALSFSFSLSPTLARACAPRRNRYMNAREPKSERESQIIIWRVRERKERERREQGVGVGARDAGYIYVSSISVRVSYLSSLSPSCQRVDNLATPTGLSDGEYRYGTLAYTCVHISVRGEEGCCCC